MSIHKNTSYTIFGHAFRMIDDRGDLSTERYGTEFEHHVIDDRVYVQIDSMLLDQDALRSLSIDVQEMQIRVDHEAGVDDDA